MPYFDGIEEPHHYNNISTDNNREIMVRNLFILSLFFSHDRKMIRN
jgi:hypothetical protein